MSDLRCPSSDNENGDLILGEGPRSGVLAHSAGRISKTHQENDLTTTRLSGRCATTQCQYWSGSCDVGRFVAASAVQLRLHALPRCGIRSECRWFLENGRDACGACALVRYE